MNLVFEQKIKFIFFSFPVCFDFFKRFLLCVFHTPEPHKRWGLGLGLYQNLIFLNFEPFNKNFAMNYLTYSFFLNVRILIN
jgi:hypothetical protein